MGGIARPPASLAGERVREPREATMEDRAILDCIHGFVAEEHRIRSLCERGELDPATESARLAELETGLDQMWALLRRRRSLRAQGIDPDNVPDGYEAGDTTSQAGRHSAAS